MLRYTINADEATGLDNEIERLRAKCRAASLPDADAELIVANVRNTLSELQAQGRKLADIGSQIAAERTVSGDNYEICLRFGQSSKRSWLHRLLDAVRGR